MAWNGQVSRTRLHRRDEPPVSRQRQLLPPQGLPVSDALPSDSRARLPANYEAAKSALVECVRIDECKSWADKAAALASYARQARDGGLRVMAERIHARAIRRCGELLKQVPSGQGSKNQYGELRDGTATRQKAAKEAGLSERQRVTAMRVANVPEARFDALVESTSPPTITQLAGLGQEVRAAQGQRSTHPDPVRAARARKMLWSIRDFCQDNAPAELAGACAAHDVELMRELVAGLRQWLDQFVANLPHAEGSGSDAKQSSG